MTPEMEKLLSFEPLSDGEKLDKKDQEELNETYKSLAEAAAACLRSDMFIKYKEKYEIFRDKATMVCSKIPTTNINEYAFIVHEIMSKLDAMRYLMELVEKDARRT